MDKNSQVEALECRQRHIIEQLQEIKTRLLAMQKNLNVTKPSVQLNAAQLKALNVSSRKGNETKQNKYCVSNRFYRIITRLC